MRISFHFQGKAGKYTEYSNVTGISKTAGQSIDDNGEKSPCSNDDVVDSLNAMSLFLQHSIPALTARTRQFAVDRDWERYHTPRNLVLALIGELGELAEIFQFKGDEEQQVLSVEEQDKIKQELADVTIYLVRLADMSGVSFLDQTTQ
jgi:dCTP diphosphatase